MMRDANETRKARWLRPVPVAIGLLAALLLPATTVVGQAPARAVAPVCQANWHALEVPGVTDLRGELLGVDAAGASDAWAVGERWPTEGVRSLALHWDGETWTRHPVPNDPTHLDSLSSVAAIGPGRAWAVGVDIDGSGTLPDRSLVVRWTGEGWERVPSPNAGTAPDENGTLGGVTSLAASDAWAVGSYRDPAPRPLTLHWDGTAWTVVPAPTPTDAEAAWLNAVSGTAPDDVWAVGGTIRLADSTRQPFALHWDGTAWTQHPLPVEADGESDLLDVVAIGPDEVWAVGVDDASALRLRWDGTSWQRTPATAGIAHYSGVAAVGPSNAWTVGTRVVLPAEELRTLTERYDGRRWIDVPGPVVEPIEERLEDVAALVGEQWAVGSSFRPNEPGSEAGELIPLIARRCGSDDVAVCHAFVGDWTGSGRDGLGWWCDGKTKLRASNGTVTEFIYGRPGDVPVVADWNGNGKDTVSVIRDGTWHVNNALRGGAAERTFVYGRVSRGDVPITGRWDRGKLSLPGITRDREWHLRNEQSGGDATWRFVYGRLTEGDLPLVGDWNGDRRDTAGIVRRGEWHLRNAHSGGASDISYIYGRVLAGDVPVVGDWIGDGMSSPGIVRDGQWNLKYEHGGGPADRVITFPAP
jgi:hypothetical protein